MARKRLSNLNSEDPNKGEPAASPKVKPTPAPDAQPAADTSPATETAQSPKKAPEKTTEKTTEKTFSVEPLEIDVLAVEVKDEEPADRQPSSSVSLQSPEETLEPQSSVHRQAEASYSPPQSGSELQSSEATIAELNATLETVRQTARQRESELLNQVARLQADLEAKQTQVDQLQADLRTKQTQVDQLQADLKTGQSEFDQLQSELEQSSQLKAELADAKKMILQLSQVNAQPAPVAPPAPLPSQRRAAEPELESASSQLTHPARSQAQPQRDDRQPAALQRQPSYPTRPAPLTISPEKTAPEQKSAPRLPEQEGKLSDADLGWVD